MKKIALNFMRLLSLTVILALVVPVMASAQGKANFAGSWALNAAKSTQPPAGGQGGGGARMGGGGGDFTATQEANLLSVSRTRTGQDGAATTNVTKYTLDGKETVTTTQRGESKTTATWSADGKTLTIVTKAATPNGERVSTEEWTLTDAKTLTVTATRNGQDGTPVKTTMVYDKK